MGVICLLVRLVQVFALPADVGALVQVEQERLVLQSLVLTMRPNQAAEAGDVGTLRDGIPAAHTPSPALCFEHLQPPGTSLQSFLCQGMTIMPATAAPSRQYDHAT